MPDNPVTLPPDSAAFIARGFVDWLAERTGKPADQLRVSVSNAICSRRAQANNVYLGLASPSRLTTTMLVEAHECSRVCSRVCSVPTAAAGRLLQVGRDPRLSGPALAAALAAGLAGKGVAVTDFGPATTPAMFMSCILDGEFGEGITHPGSLIKLQGCIAPRLWFDLSAWVCA